MEFFSLESLFTQGDLSIAYHYLIEGNKGTSFLWLLLFSVGIASILGACIVNDWHMKFARLLRLTKKTARSSVWIDVFYDINRHVIINFKNGRRIFGWPKYFSDDPEKEYIFLHHPAWIVQEDGKSKYIRLNIEGVLITPGQKIESIEFLKKPTKGGSHG